MKAMDPQQIGKPIPRAFNFVWMPSRWIEYAYYFAFSYSVIAGYLDVEVPLLAAGITIALATYCAFKMSSRSLKVFTPIGFLIATATSMILVQIVIHDVSPMDGQNRAFILWICGLIIVQSLSLRTGFLRRCTMIVFALGLIAVPHLGSMMASVERAGAMIEIGGGLRNPNGLAVWFGFCLVSFAILGIETQRATARILYWLAATGCLFIVGLTVSRGSMFGAALALTVAFRHVLRRGFVPLLLLVILIGVFFSTGLFDQVISKYAERGMEDTGREHLWPEAIEHISTSPMFGVGPAEGPHNSFLYFAVSSGVVPLALWVAFWLTAAWRSFWDAAQSEYSPFRIPFLLYGLVTFMVSDISTEVWALLVLTVGAGSRVSYFSGQFLMAYRTRGSRIAQPLRLSSKAETIER
jgi:O-antigen ligase